MKRYLILLILVLLPIKVVANETISYKPIPIPYMQIPINPIQQQSSGAIIYTGQTTAGTDNKMIARATYYYRAGDLNTALREINSTLMYYPDDVQVQFLKSQISYKLGDLEESIECANKAIEILQHPKLYIWRVFLLVQTNDKKNINQISKDLKLIIADSGPYENRVLGGAYNEYIQEILSKDRISSDMISTTFETLLKLMIENDCNTRTIIPVLARYTQYIFDLDNSDPLFVKYGKDKNSILKAYTSSFQGQYSEIMTGLLTYASGDREKGSQQIESGFKNIDVDKYNLNYAVGMIENTNRIIHPYESEYTIYGIGAKYKYAPYRFGIIIDSVKAGSPADLAGIKAGDKILALNEKNLSEYPSSDEIDRVVSYDNNTFIKLTLSHAGPVMKWLGLATVYTVSVPVNYPEKVTEKNYIRIKDVQLKNGQYLSNYVKLSD